MLIKIADGPYLVNQIQLTHEYHVVAQIRSNQQYRLVNKRLVCYRHPYRLTLDTYVTRRETIDRQQYENERRSFYFEPLLPVAQTTDINYIKTMNHLITNQIHFDRIDRNKMARRIKQKTSVLEAREIVDCRFINGKLLFFLDRNIFYNRKESLLRGRHLYRSID